MSSKTNQEEREEGVDGGLLYLYKPLFRDRLLDGLIYYRVRALLVFWGR